MTEDKNTGQPDEETHVMSHEEVKDYAGLTLNEQGEEEGRAEENSYIRVKTIHLNELPWWKKIAGLAVIFALIIVGLAIAGFFFLWGAVIFVAGAIFYFLKKYFFK